MAHDGERLRAPEVLHQGPDRKPVPTPLPEVGDSVTHRFLCQTSETSF